MVRYVSVSGTDAGDCSDPANPCRTPQYAVDLSLDGDDVRLAAGVYTGVQQIDGVTQTVYLSKSLALRGGYTTTDWTDPDPQAYPTVLDAAGLGREIFITGPISVTLEGLGVTRGDATGAGGMGLFADVGGGVFVFSATVTLSNCQVISNSARVGGGGVFLHASSGASLDQIDLVGNMVIFEGGGLYAFDSFVTLAESLVSENQSGNGGG